MAASEELTKLSIDNATAAPATTTPTPATNEPIVQTSAGPETATQTVERVTRASEAAAAPTFTSINTPTPTKTPDFYDQAYKSESRAAQKEINSINRYANAQIESLKPRQDERVRENAAVNTLTGLSGSTEANRTTEGTTKVNQRENDMVRKEAAAKVQSALGKVSQNALNRATFDRETFQQKTERETAQRVENLSSIVTLAQSGVDYDKFKEKDPKGYKYLADAMGGEELLKAAFTLNRPQETILDKSVQGGKYMVAYKNPITGAVRIETVDLGLPPEYSTTIDAGDRLLAIPTGWDGDVSKLISINKGLTPSQKSSGSGGGGTGSGGGIVNPDGSLNVSSAAQNIIDQVNLGVPLDDLIKGTSNAAQALRNEVLAGLNAQGGLTDKSAEILAEGKAVVDQMLSNKAYNALGGYSTIFGGQFSTGYGDAKAQAGQLQAILARDNLGLLKGAMSDKDLAFIQSMSSGFEGEGTQSEGFIKNRLEEIQTKLSTKLSSIPQESTGGTDARSIADGAGYDYEAMRDSGMSDQAIISAIQNQ